MIVVLIIYGRVSGGRNDRVCRRSGEDSILGPDAGNCDGRVSARRSVMLQEPRTTPVGVEGVPPCPTRAQVLLFGRLLVPQ